MAARPGWYPYRSPNASTTAYKQDSWSDLTGKWPLESNRRYWDGSKWEGAAVPNDTIGGIGICPACKRLTGFLPLTVEEVRPYLKGANEALIRYARRTGFSTGFVATLTHKELDRSAWSQKELKAWIDDMTNTVALLKCVDCSYHVGVCMACLMVNPAIPGRHKCKGCGIEYIALNGQIHKLS